MSLCRNAAICTWFVPGAICTWLIEARIFGCLVPASANDFSLFPPTGPCICNRLSRVFACICNELSLFMVLTLLSPIIGVQ